MYAYFKWHWYADRRETDLFRHTTNHTCKVYFSRGSGPGNTHERRLRVLLRWSDDHPSITNCCSNDGTSNATTSHPRDMNKTLHAVINNPPNHDSSQGSNIIGRRIRHARSIIECSIDKTLLAGQCCAFVRCEWPGSRRRSACNRSRANLTSSPPRL